MNDNFLSGSVVVMALVLIVSSINQLRSDISRINVKLDKIAKQVGVPSIVTESINTELKNLISEGKKIKAIKKYRIITGLGLKEAKDYVDALSEQEEKV